VVYQNNQRMSHDSGGSWILHLTFYAYWAPNRCAIALSDVPSQKRIEIAKAIPPKQCEFLAQFDKTMDEIGMIGQANPGILLAGFIENELVQTEQTVGVLRQALINSGKSLVATKYLGRL
jgi:hypothetical protein